jgi:hypothetical protein
LLARYLQHQVRLGSWVAGSGGSEDQGWAVGAPVLEKKPGSRMQERAPLKAKASPMVAFALQQHGKMSLVGSGESWGGGRQALR